MTRPIAMLVTDDGITVMRITILAYSLFVMTGTRPGHDEFSLTSDSGS
jgi:hypothetical protein